MTDEQAEELTEYEVDINGVPHTLLLSKEEAETRGLSKPSSKAKQPANKARTARDK